MSSIIFMNEVDSIISRRNGNDSASNNHVKILILQLWQNLEDGGHQVVLVGVTNRPEAIAPRIFRRFIASLCEAAAHEVAIYPNMIAFTDSRQKQR